MRDGTYLIGSSCIITEQDEKSLFCGGLYKFRVTNEELNPYLLLALLNSYIVKRQFRTKQFTRDVIDTLGNRIGEVFIPIPKDRNLKKHISSIIESVIAERISARSTISSISRDLIGS